MTEDDKKNEMVNKMVRAFNAWTPPPSPAPAVGELANMKRVCLAPDADVGVLRGQLATAIARISQLEAGLRELVDAVIPEVNEKGAGGYLLARLDDARAILKGRS